MLGNQGTARRSALVALVGLVTVVALAGCGGNDDADTSAPDGQEQGDSHYPVTIEHRYGSTTVTERPERLITLGFSEQDIALAFGVVPVADREWFGERPNAVWPWAEDELGDATIEVLSGSELNYEQIASLNPDLIIASYGGIEEDEFTTLSDIAPTVAQSADHPDYGTPWDVQVATFGEVLGEPERAEELIAETRQVISDAREAHPEFEDATGLFAYDFGDGEIGVYAPADPRGRILTDLGFELPGPVEDILGDEFSTTISLEQLDLLDADVVLWVTYVEPGTTGIEGRDVYRDLPIATEGRDVFIAETDVLNGAVSFSSPLSIPTAIDELVPLLAAAIDGDPATTAGD